MTQTNKHRKIFYVEIDGEVSDKRLQQIIHAFNTAQSVPLTITGWGEHPAGAVVNVGAVEPESGDDAQVPQQADVPQQTKLITLISADWSATTDELDTLEKRFLEKAHNGVVAFPERVNVYTIPLADEVKAKVVEGLEKEARHKDFLSSNTYAHAVRELNILGYKTDGTEDGINKILVENIFEGLEVLYHQGHSGGSAPYVANLLKELFLFNPASPLTGKEEEWSKPYNSGDASLTQQNLRSTNVFRNTNDNKAYQIDYYVFQYPDGGKFTNNKSRKYVEFPYTPKHVVVKVDAEGFGDIPNETKPETQD